MFSEKLKQRIEYFMHLPTWRIRQYYENRELEFRCWLEDEVPSDEFYQQECQKALTVSEEYLDTGYDYKLLRKRMKFLLREILSPRQRKVILRRIIGGETLIQIGTKMSLSRTTISNIEKAALRKLKHHVRKRFIQEFVYLMF